MGFKHELTKVKSVNSEVMLFSIKFHRVPSVHPVTIRVSIREQLYYNNARLELVTPIHQETVKLQKFNAMGQ